MEKCRNFIDQFWEEYKSEFSSAGIDDKTLEALTKNVLYMRACRLSSVPIIAETS